MNKKELIEALKRNIKMRDKSESMYKNYPLHVEKYLDWLEKTYGDGALKDAKLGEQAVQDYLFHIKEQRLKENPKLNPYIINTTLNLKLYALTYFYRNVLRLQIHISPFRAVSRESAFLSEDELRKFIMAVDEPLYRVYVAVAYELALRVSEAIRIRVSDIDRQRWWVYVHSGKGGRTGYIPIFDKEVIDLLKWWLNQNKSKWLFPGKSKGRHITARAIEKAMLKYARKIGIDIAGSTTHFLRHTRQQQLMNAGWREDMRILFLRQRTGKAIEKYEHELAMAILEYAKEKPLRDVFTGLDLTRF